MDNLLREAGRLADLTFMLERWTAIQRKRLEGSSSTNGAAQNSQIPLIESEGEDSSVVPGFQAPSAVFEDVVGSA